MLVIKRDQHHYDQVGVEPAKPTSNRKYRPTATSNKHLFLQTHSEKIHGFSAFPLPLRPTILSPFPLGAGAGASASPPFRNSCRRGVDSCRVWKISFFLTDISSRDGSSPSRGAAETAEPWPEPCLFSHCRGLRFVSMGRAPALGSYDWFDLASVACLWIWWILAVWSWLPSRLRLCPVSLWLPAMCSWYSASKSWQVLASPRTQFFVTWNLDSTSMYIVCLPLLVWRWWHECLHVCSIVLDSVRAVRPQRRMKQPAVKELAACRYGYQVQYSASSLVCLYWSFRSWLVAAWTYILLLKKKSMTRLYWDTFARI